MTGKAQPRPALRKAADSDVHPSLPTPSSGETSLLRAGASTADAVLTPQADRSVTLTVTIPKSLRKSVRREAARRRITVDEVVAEALRERPSR